MSSAASFAKRWASDNLTRDPSAHELELLALFLSTCDGDQEEAARRARQYYVARSPAGMTELWQRRVPDSEDILKSCQDVYIVPLKPHNAGGRRVTLVRLPASAAADRPLSARALLTRWLMILDLRLREDPAPGEEVIFIDVSDLQPGHLKNHFKGSYWKDFVWCMKHAYPTRFSEVHIINTHRLKTFSLLLLHIGLYPWRRKVVQIHSGSQPLSAAMCRDLTAVGLPTEYGGRAGDMKDLNDEWTKKILSNSKWLQSEERHFYDTVLTPLHVKRRSQPSSVPLRGRSHGRYDVITRTQSCGTLLEEPVYGQYRVHDREYYI